MALVDNAWYVDDGDNSTTGWWGITAWSNNGGAGTIYAAGTIRRQTGTPTVGNERCYIAVVGGTGGTGADPLTTFTRGVKITDGTVTWQECTGIAGLNGDLTNTPTWTTVKNTVVTLGQVIQRNNGASYQICTTGGTAGNGAEPSFSNTAGTTTADNTVTWTSLGVVGGFSIFGCPHARMANAFASTWGQAGNSFFAKSTSAETQTTSITLTSPGTAAAPCKCFSVGTGATPPTSVTAGASIAATGASNINLNNSQFTEWDGFTFSGGSVANASTITFAGSNNSSSNYRNCNFTLATTSASAAFQFNNTGGLTSAELFFWACVWTFGSATGQQFKMSAGSGIRVTMIGGSVAVGASIPTTLINFVNGVLQLIGVDLSAIPSGKTLIGAGGAGIALIQNCKLAASVTIAATPTNQGSGETQLILSDSSGTNYRQEYYQYAGTQTIETTIIRTGGAATPNGTGYSWKIVTSANSKWAFPFEMSPLVIWNSSTVTNVTLTIYGIWGGGAVPTTADLWPEFGYMGASGNPIYTMVSAGKASDLAAAANWSTNSSTWGGSTTAFKMTLTLSAPQPQLNGLIEGFLKFATASTTYYIDPVINLS